MRIRSRGSIYFILVTRILWSVTLRTVMCHAVIEKSRQLGTLLFSHKNVHEVDSRWHVI